MGRALEIDDTRSASELRALAKREKITRVARRMPAIANALDGYLLTQLASGGPGQSAFSAIRSIADTLFMPTVQTA